MADLVTDSHCTSCTNQKPADNRNADMLKESLRFNMSDNAVMQLLRKLDEGTQTIVNLRSILTLKTAELNELIAQLELTAQAIEHVESTTAQIESMLEGLSSPGDAQHLLICAEASLDSAIKSANRLHQPVPSKPRLPCTSSSNTTVSGGNTCDPEQRPIQRSARFASRIRYKPDPKYILQQLDALLQELALDSTTFYDNLGTTTDITVLQKAKVDLDIAKTIALTTKSSMKRRSILLRSSRRRSNIDEIKTLGVKIRENVSMWNALTRDAPLEVDGQKVLDVLDHEDDLIARNLPPNYPPSPKGSTTTHGSFRKSVSTRSTEPLTSKSRKPVTLASVSAVPAAAASRNTSTVGSVKRSQRHPVATRPSVKSSHTTGRCKTPSKTTTSGATMTSKTSKAKNPPGQASTQSVPSIVKTSAATTVTGSDAKKSPVKPSIQRGPGSTLRIRSMLAKRNLQKSTE